MYRMIPVIGYVTGVRARSVTVTLAVRYRIPPSVMPRPAFEEADQGQPTAPDEAELGECVDCVLAAGGCEATGGQAQRRDGVAVQLDEVDGGAHRARTGGHDRDPSRALMRCRAVRSSCSSRGDTASRLRGSARITTRSVGSRSSRIARAACRRRRDTRCRQTALPTALETIRPILGPGSPISPERSAYRTRSGWEALVPWLTVAPNSVDRVIRLCAGSTASDPAASRSQ